MASVVRFRGCFDWITELWRPADARPGTPCSRPVRGRLRREEVRVPTYETLFITPPNLTEDQEKATVDGLAQVVSEGGGEFTANERMGRRRLAYPIRKFDEGVYNRFLYDAGVEVPKELERRIRLSDQVLRSLTVRLEREWAVFAKEDAVLAAQRRVEAAAEAVRAAAEAEKEAAEAEKQAAEAEKQAAEREAAGEPAPAEDAAEKPEPLAEAEPATEPDATSEEGES